MDDISLKNIEKQILAFNNDPRVFALRNRYTTKTFLDIMSVARSENRHSAFLAWLLKGDDFTLAPQDHPIVHLLDCIIKRVQDQGIEVPEEGREGKQKQKNKIDNYDKLKEIILTRNIKSIKIDKASTEETLGTLCGDPNLTAKLNRIDIYIHCFIYYEDKKQNPQKGKKVNIEEKKLEIEFIIENKVGSSEGGKDEYKLGVYKELTQTQRYYKACIERENKESYDLISSFIFLSPDEQEAKSPYFINISYQDVLDYIIEPLLLSATIIPPRIRTIIEEYVASLSFPTPSEGKKENMKNALIMAVRKSEEEEMLAIWKDYGEMLEKAIIEYVNKGENKTLVGLCEVNKSLLIAILRIATNKKDATVELKKLYYDFTDAKDYSEFIITYDDSSTSEPLAKGIFFYKVVERWVNRRHNQANKKPDDIFNIVWQKNNKNIKIINIISGDDYDNLETTKENGRDPKTRFFRDDPGPITIDGTIYYLSKEWGVGDRLEAWLKFLGFEYDKFKDAVNDNTDEISDTEFLNSIGIKSITWKKIMK